MFITPEVAYVCELLHKYDVLPLECDGHTMVVSCLLDRFCIPHQRIVGEVTLAGTCQIIRPHLWIEYDEYIIDYRLRMWARKTEDNVSLVLMASLSKIKVRQFTLLKELQIKP